MVFDILMVLLAVLISVHIVVLGYVAGFAWDKDRSLLANYKRVWSITGWLVVRFLKPGTPRP